MKLPVVFVKYSEDQSREPAGSDEGGQFASGGGEEGNSLEAIYKDEKPKTYGDLLRDLL